MKPTILIAATSRWFPTARLAAALVRAGCIVDAVCAPRHPLAKVRGVRKIYPYRGMMPLASVTDAIRKSAPELIVPGDDLATSHLHCLHRREVARGEQGRILSALIERSLGSPESFPVVYARADFIETVRAAGVRAPRTEEIADVASLKSWFARTGIPTVLKANGTSGGDGVRVVHNFEAALQAYCALQAPPSMVRAAKRAVADYDKTLLWPSLLRRRSVVNAQEFIAGREATSAVACWQGKVLASLHLEVLNKRDAAGPSSVVRLVENNEMSTAAEITVRMLKLSGLHGFDFMLEADSGKAHLIEINPRATQVGHLALGAGRDLPAALYAVLTGEPIRAAAPITVNDTIALFPQEWTRDARSPFLQSAYHDVPWDEPGLLSTFSVKPQRPEVTRSPSAQGHPLSAVRVRRV